MHCDNHSWRMMIHLRNISRGHLINVLRHLSNLSNCASSFWFCYLWNCETQPPASIGWVALSSVIVRPSVPHCNTSSYLHYMMFQTIQTIYFLWGYDPGNMSVSFIAELSPVYCCLVAFLLCSCSVKPYFFTNKFCISSWIIIDPYMQHWLHWVHNCKSIIIWK